jgi:transcription elongation GreA/GreB family factor
MSDFKVGQHAVYMTKKNKPEIKLGATVRLKVHSGETVTGQVVYMWEEKSVPMVRVSSGDLVYNVPARMLIDETKSRT